jgi:hypothetical protein
VLAVGYRPRHGACPWPMCIFGGDCGTYDACMCITGLRMLLILPRCCCACASGSSRTKRNFGGVACLPNSCATASAQLESGDHSSFFRGMVMFWGRAALCGIARVSRPGWLCDLSCILHVKTCLICCADTSTPCTPCRCHQAATATASSGLQWLCGGIHASSQACMLDGDSWGLL